MANVTPQGLNNGSQPHQVTETPYLLGALAYLPDSTPSQAHPHIAPNLCETARPVIPPAYSIHPTASTVNKLNQDVMYNLNFPPPPDLTSFIVKEDDRYIAGGRFGDVYKCRCFNGLPQTVAVKAFRFKFPIDENANDRQSIKMPRRELGIWRRARHTNVVPFLGVAYGFGMRGAMSLVSLWMPNGSLHLFLAKYNDALGVGPRLQFLLDVANGLRYLHSHFFPIIHGDLNCNNVLLDEDYTARLTDFGYASLLGNIPEAFNYLQRSTMQPGTLRWIAPEQIESEETFNWTTKSDIYSYGCVALQESSWIQVTDLPVLIALQVLSGKQPWSEVRNDAAVILRLARGDKPTRPKCQTMHDSHWSFIQQCLSRMEERPIAEEIVITVQQLLMQSPQSQSLRDMLASRSSHTYSLPEESLPQPASPVYERRYPVDARAVSVGPMPAPSRFLMEFLMGATANYGGYQCRWLSCQQACKDFNELVCHMGTLHVQGPAGRLFVCEWMTGKEACGRQCRRDAFRRHIATHVRSKIPCTECGKIFSRVDVLRAHVKVHAN